MKIYFLTSKLDFETSGGSVEEFDVMMRTLQELGNEVVAVTTFSEANRISRVLPYRVIEENIRRRDLISIQRGVYRILRKYENDADFFHIDGHNFLYGAGFYRRFGGKVPISAFFNRELGCFPEDVSTLFTPPDRSWHKLVKKNIRWLMEHTVGMWLASAIDLTSFITPQYREMYQEFGLRCGHCLILGDPMDFPKIMRENGIADHSYRDRIEHTGPIRLFFSSRMAPGKGFDLLLAGFARVEHKDRFRLVLGGTGPEQDQIHLLAKELRVDAYVEFPGWMTKEELYKQFKIADIFIQVGWRREGASMTLLYAMAFGLPSIVPRGSGMAWQAGASALTVRNGDHDELAHTIERLGEDRALRAELSKNAYKRLQDDQLDHKKIIRKWFDSMQRISASAQNLSKNASSNVLSAKIE